jgi:hypothetical protein
MMLDWLFFGIAFLFFLGGLRVLNPIVTRVRERSGLAMAWGAAILGFMVIVSGMGLISLIGIAIAWASAEYLPV